MAEKIAAEVTSQEVGDVSSGNMPDPRRDLADRITAAVASQEADAVEDQDAGPSSIPQGNNGSGPASPNLSRQCLAAEAEAKQQNAAPETVSQKSQNRVLEFTSDD